MTFFMGFIAGISAASMGFVAIKGFKADLFCLPSTHMDEWF